MPRRLYLAGGIAALVYLVAQTVQEVVLAQIGPVRGDDLLQSQLSTPDRLRAFLLWLGFWVIPLAFHALYVRTAELRPTWARIGLFASLVWVGCELSYRTIELFVITGQWTAAWSAATGAARAELAHRIALWDDIVTGWYVLLLTVHLVGAAAFAGAVGWRGRWCDRALFVTLVGYAVLLVLRLCTYLVPALAPLCNHLYFPVVAPSFLALAVALLAARR